MRGKTKALAVERTALATSEGRRDRTNSKPDQLG
jgi:hypothetical protein